MDTAKDTPAEQHRMEKEDIEDLGTVLDGRRAVKEKLIDELGGLSDALTWLYKEIEQG